MKRDNEMIENKGEEDNNYLAENNAINTLYCISHTLRIRDKHKHKPPMTKATERVLARAISIIMSSKMTSRREYQQAEYEYA